MTANSFFGPPPRCRPIFKHCLLCRGWVSAVTLQVNSWRVLVGRCTWFDSIIRRSNDLRRPDATSSVTSATFFSRRDVRCNVARRRRRCVVHILLDPHLIENPCSSRVPVSNCWPLDWACCAMRPSHWHSTALTGNGRGSYNFVCRYVKLMQDFDAFLNSRTNHNCFY